MGRSGNADAEEEDDDAGAWLDVETRDRADDVDVALLLCSVRDGAVLFLWFVSAKMIVLADVFEVDDDDDDLLEAV